MKKNTGQSGHESDTAADVPTTPPIDTPNTPPQTMYETLEMTSREIADQNAAYRSMGLPCVIVDVSRFSAKLERQESGTYKRTKMTRPKAEKNGEGAEKN